ncbi:hypothetical protein [Nonomuraea sp. LPB2021202275-12-8]|uniref:hypothetical protein n=1 Tax=Nonomuraea sp. LPB2021202275-12-8 TaxID=3120159 RepID=UPI00300C2C50
MVLALAGPLLQGAPASGSATAGDPITAIQRQLVKGHGVRITRVNTFNAGDGWERFKPTKGVVGFGDGTVKATDLWHMQLGKTGTRIICMGGRVWEYNPQAKRPHGKIWSTGKWPCDGLQTGLLRLDKPAEFAAVLATTTTTKAAGIYDGSPTTLHEGSISFRQLWDVGANLRGDIKDEHGEWAIDWRLWIGKDGLVRRAWSKWRQPDLLEDSTYVQGWYGFVADVRYSDWGTKVTIKPPPAARTIDLDKM